MQQSYKSTWNDTEDPQQQEANFADALQAVSRTDWGALADFDDIAQAARQLRLTALATPTRLGGRGLTNRHLCALFRQFTRLDTASAHIIGYFSSLGVNPLLFTGNFELGNYLADVASGGGLGIFAITEPQGGSHLAGMKTTARKTSTGWELNGVKMYIAHAQAGTFYSICVPTEAGFKVFMVDRKNPGLSISQSFRMAYMRRIILNEITLKHVQVADEFVIHDPAAVYHPMMIGRTQIMASKIGHIERCLDHLLPFISDRQISTGRMLDNRYVQRKVRNLELAIAVLEALLELNLALEAKDGTAFELALAAKITGVELAIEASQVLQSLHGARGLDPATNIPHVADDMRVWTVMEGCSQPMGHFIAFNYLKRKPWLAGFTAAHPDSFAAIPKPEQFINQTNVDMVALGYALSWALVHAATHSNGTATAETEWFLTRRIEHYVQEVTGPLDQARFLAGSAARSTGAAS
jgi:alkylation response protein AidB-like acyl-CoA dehydrogenase